MVKYYTRACNFYYGSNSRDLIKKKLSLPLSGAKNISFDTLEIIVPTAFAIAVVGLLESLMTASIVDELTDTTSSKNRECVGQG